MSLTGLAVAILNATVSVVTGPGFPFLKAEAASTASSRISREPSKTGDYFFPDSDSRYLTDEEVSQYSSSELELAKNEIYARHGRKFVTQRISDYFNSKSWYQGTVDPDIFDAQQSSIFNEYEMANIMKIDERMAQLG